MNQLERNKLETTLLETADDRANECTLDGIRLVDTICASISFDPKPHIQETRTLIMIYVRSSLLGIIGAA